MCSVIKMNSMIWYGGHIPHISVNNNDYVLENIFFYDDKGKIIISMDNFDDYHSFQFLNETRLRRKLNLNRKENFIIKHQKGAIRNNSYNLYIYLNNVSVKYVGKEIINRYSYGGDEVWWSSIYKTYVIHRNNDNDYIHREYLKTISHKKSRLENKVTEIICSELLWVNSFKPRPQEEIEKTLKKISKLNRRINEENKKLILREKNCIKVENK